LGDAGQSAVIGTLWLGMGLAVVALLVGWPALVIIALLVGTAITATLLLRLQQRSRWRNLLRLTAEARRLLATTAADNTAPPPALPANTEDDLPAVLVALRERLQTQMREVAKKSRNLEALLDALDEPVLVCGEQWQVIVGNAAAERLLDAPKGGLLGRPLRELFTRRELLDLHDAARAGRTARGRVRLTTSAGTRTFEASAVPLPAAWGEGIFGAILCLRDITELARAVQLQTDFVANASHELRTPVAALRAAIETLDDGAKDEPLMRDRLLAVCGTHAERLEEMVRDLMDLSRMATPDITVNLSPVNLGELKETLLQSFEHILTQRELKLNFEFDEQALSGLVCDQKLLVIMLRNLIENATKFARPSTTVRIIGGPASDPAAVRFSVADRGLGIPLDQQPRVFERFYQVDSARTGTSASKGKPGARGSGLGLAIVKQAAEALGGTVGLESVWGQGTTVWLEVPRTPDRQA